MKKTLFIALGMLLAFAVSDIAKITKTAEAGWRPRPRVVQPEPVKKIVLDWEECSVEYPLPEDGQKQSKVDPIIKQFDKALEEQKLVVIYLYTDDMRKKYEAKTKLCESFFNDVLCKEKVGEKLKSCLRLKLNVSKLDDKKLKKAYKFSKSYPAIYLYDFQGKKIKSTTSRDENTIISYISYSEKKVEKLVEKLEKKAEKEAEKKEE